MAEYIDREKIRELAYLDTNGWSHGEHPMVVEMDDIDDIPAADVAPVVHGRWILADFGCYCDICAHHVPDYKRSKFCPHCGAKMYGGTKDG